MRIYFLTLGLTLLSIGLSACGVDDVPMSSSNLLLASNSNECKALVALNKDIKVPNKGYGTLTITHPEIVSHFTFTKVLGKFTQVKSIADSQETVRRIIRSFITKKVAGIAQEQPLRPFVVPELLCPLLDSKQAKASFCGAQFFNDQPAAIAAALAFLDKKESFGNFAAIDRMLQPLTFIKRPPRFDLQANEQTVEARVIYGLRDSSGAERKPATVILEFAGTSQKEFYESLVKLFIQFKDKNDAASRKHWAQGIENSLDGFLASNAGVTDRWAINQIRINELAFRGNDILWDFREYNFPSPTSSINEFAQVPVANTPWVDFETKDRDPLAMADRFTDFLNGKGLTAEDLDAEQSIDFFEEFMSSPKVKIKNSAALQTFVQTLTKEKNESGVAGSKAFPYERDTKWMAPAGLARPGMRFFDGDTSWSTHLKETCQGCHVASSSIASDERIDSIQGFYHISPRKLPSDATVGPTLAGSNILSNFLLRETQFRFQSMIKLVGCLDPAPVPEPTPQPTPTPTPSPTPDPTPPAGGHNSGTTKQLIPGERTLVEVKTFTCANSTSDKTLTQCTKSNGQDSYTCAQGHTELVRCLQASGTMWLIACEEGLNRKIAQPTLLNSCDMPLPSHML